MKTRLWLLNLAIIFINCARLAVSCALFYRFFLFRMIEVTGLYIFYLILDSAEYLIISAHQNTWNWWKKAAFYFNDALFFFAVISGIIFRLPILYFFIQLGLNPDNAEKILVHIWFWPALAMLLWISIFNIIRRREWGRLQNMAADYIFLAYCFYEIPLGGIILGIMALLALMLLEAQKTGWDIKEMKKKDCRFRAKKDPRLV